MSALSAFSGSLSVLGLIMRKVLYVKLIESCGTLSERQCGLWAIVSELGIRKPMIILELVTVWLCDLEKNMETHCSSFY